MEFGAGVCHPEAENLEPGGTKLGRKRSEGFKVRADSFGPLMIRVVKCKDESWLTSEMSILDGLSVAAVPLDRGASRTHIALAIGLPTSFHRKCVQ